MDQETEISTPVESSDVDTSSNVESVTQDTSTEEPTTVTETAETETTTQEPVLYAGKYKSIEEFEKGYKELNKELTKRQNLQAKYDELLKQQDAQNAIRLEKARERGFDSVQAQEIADRATVEEFNAYVGALNMVAPEYFEAVRQNLLNYYNTENRAYLDEAKRYFPSNFIEKVALDKQKLVGRLQGEYQQKAQQAREANEQKLAETLRADYAEFLSDIKENVGKAQALQMFCNAGFIQSKEDMQVFADVYNKIADFIRPAVIKEYEAQKTIEATKQAAQIEGSAGTFVFGDSAPTYAQLAVMSQEDFEKACDKYGVDRIMAAK